MSAPLVLIPLGPGEYIALEPDQLAAARDRAIEVLGPGWGGDRGAASSGAPEALLTAQQMETATGVPSGWYLESARRREIPFVRLGRYPRFQLSKLIEHGLVMPPAEAGGEWARCQKGQRAAGGAT